MTTAALLDELVGLLDLERLDGERFRGQPKDTGWGTVFGGQVLGQALSAAGQTVSTDRHAHSLHAYFLRAADVARPILYDVDRTRDGKSFTTRRVVASQDDRPIFTLAASFQREERGFVHQDPMPDVPPPEALPTEQERYAERAQHLPEPVRQRIMRDRPFEIRSTDPPRDPMGGTPRAPRRAIWLRAVAPLPDRSALHRCLLAFASDYSFVGTALLPHGVSLFTRGMQVASLDHAMWFHAPFRVDEWLLHVMESPVANEARALVRGSVFTRDGRLVASTAQEGLVRQRS